MSAIGIILQSTADFFLPRLCYGCESALTIDESYLCTTCLDSLKLLSTEELSLAYLKTYSDGHYVDEFFSLYHFDENICLINAIHQLKYGGRFYIGKYFGEKLGNELKYFIEHKPDLIIPLPLHQLKKAERGYNQAYYIAKGILKTGWFPNATISISVKKSKYTESQTHKNKEERKINIESSFKVIKPNEVAGKSVLLIDDVVTTGATTEECAKVLKLAGAKSVSVASIAYTK